MSSYDSYINVMSRKREKRDVWQWTVLLVLSTAALIWCTYALCIRFGERPTVVRFAERPEPIWNVPFPAVTICPVNQIKVDYMNITDVYHRLRALSNETRHRMKSARPLCNLDLEALAALANNTDAIYLLEHRWLVCNTTQYIDRMESAALLCDTDLASLLSLDNATARSESLIAELGKLAPTLTDTIFSSSFETKRAPSIRDHFADVWTADGRCFTFNQLNTSMLYLPNRLAIDFPMGTNAGEQSENGTNIDVEIMFGENIPSGESIDAAVVNSTHPLRALTAGEYGALDVSLQHIDANTNPMCTGPKSGFKVIIHDPHEAPIVTRNFYYASLDQTTRITLRPVVTVTELALTDRDASKRGCYFANERKLEFFTTYSQHNCELECESTYLINTCGCTGFSSPRNRSTDAVCGASNTTCMRAAAVEMLAQSRAEGRTAPCGCLPACSSVSYEADVSQGDLQLAAMRNAFKEQATAPSEKGHRFGQLTVMFKDAFYTPILRQELYNNAPEKVILCILFVVFLVAALISLVKLTLMLKQKTDYEVAQTFDSVDLAMYQRNNRNLQNVVNENPT